MFEEQALELIQETISGLQRSGLIANPVAVEGDTVLLGAGSPLDSLAFVTFIADLEDRLNRETARDFSLVLTELHEFNANVPYLSAQAMARFIARLTDGN